MLLVIAAELASDEHISDFRRRAAGVGAQYYAKHPHDV
jgi:hypothetical protein